MIKIRITNFKDEDGSEDLTISTQHVPRTGELIRTSRGVFTVKTVTRDYTAIDKDDKFHDSLDHALIVNLIVS